jgi:hypothetical protein
MIKSFLTIILTTCCLFLFSFESEKKMITIDEFGTQIFNACKNNDFETIESLIVSTEEILKTIDASGTVDSLKQMLKLSLIEKIESDQKNTLQESREGLSKSMKT